MTIDPRIEDWTARVDGAIKAEVLRMHHHLSAWERVAALIADNAELPDSYWWEFMFETYAMSQASAVRRQADSRRDVNSLMRLIIDVHKGATAVTRTWWLDTHWKPSHPMERFEAERQWQTYFGGTAGDHLDPAIPKTDTDDLKAAAAKVKATSTATSPTPAPPPSTRRSRSSSLTSTRR